MSTPLRSVAFRRERERSWRKLEAVLEKVERSGWDGLSQGELIALPTLHRAALSALSVTRSVSLDRNQLEYLEALTARSHACLYGNREGHLPAAITRFLRSGFAVAVRSTAPFVLVAFLLLLGGTLTGFLLVDGDLDRYDGIVPPGMAQGRDTTASDEALRKPLYDTGSAIDSLWFFATYLFQHNTQVALLCFVLGCAFGVLTGCLLFYNGLILGAMLALYASRGMASEFCAWILPHGVSELSAIGIAGAAGLVLGHAVLFPGRSTRLSFLAKRGRLAGRIMLGAALMLGIAALFEGFFRQLVHSISTRYAVAAVVGSLWIAYFCFAGRGQPPVATGESA